jgi:uncharacterized membrane protein YgcG
MRFPVTGLVGRWRWLAGAAAAATLVAMTFAPAANAGGPDGTLCRQDTSRVHIPSDFTVNACFDGQTLSLRDRTSAVLRVYSAGDVQSSSRFATTPSASTLLTTLITEGDTIPPDSELQLRIGSGTADVQIEVATKANRSYDLYALLLSYLPGVSSYEDVAAAEESISADIANAQTCEAHASWLGKIGCAAGLDANLQFATVKLLAQVGIDVAEHAGVIVEALVNTVWNGWDQMGQTEDLNTIATSTPTLHIAAAPASSGQSSGSGSGKTSGGGGGASGPGGPTSTPGGPSPVPAGSGRILISPCLNLRADPNGTTALIGCIPQNTIIPIDCTAQGNSVTGPYGPTTLWDHTTYQGVSGYVSDAYVYTGTSGAVAGNC